MFCDQCGSKVEPGDSWCGNCGSRVSAVEPVRPAPPPPAPPAVSPPLPKSISAAPPPPPPPIVPPPSPKSTPAAQPPPQVVMPPPPTTPRPAATSVSSGSPAETHPGGASWLKRTIVALIPILFGGGGYVAYRNIDLIRQLITRPAPASISQSRPDVSPTPAPAVSGVPSSTVKAEIPPGLAAQPPTPAPERAPEAANLPETNEVKTQSGTGSTVVTTAPPQVPMGQTADSGTTRVVRVQTAPNPAPQMPSMQVAVQPVEPTRKEPEKAPPTEPSVPVEVRPAESVQKPGLQTSEPRQPEPRGYSGPSQGTILWTGEVQKNETVVIEGDSATTGVVQGKLPGVACMIRVSHPDAAIAESPSPSNGYQKLALRFAKKGKFTVAISWQVLR